VAIGGLSHFAQFNVSLIKSVRSRNGWKQLIVLNLGTLLWFAILLFGRRGAQATAS